MYPLRTLYRLMLVVWLILVLSMGAVVGHMAENSDSSDRHLLAFLFPTKPASAPLPPVMPEKTVKPAPPPPPPLSAPAPQKPAEPRGDWVALKKGKTGGTGTLINPVITVTDKGEIEVRFPMKGAPGTYRDFHPVNIDSQSVDLMGPMGKGMNVDKRIESGVLKRVQIADHKQWVRISGIARNPASKLAAKVEYSPTLRALRIVFSEEK